MDPNSTILVFDVNETLLDPQALQPLFARVFGEADALERWFQQTLLYSGVVTIAGPYASFATLARLSLDAFAESTRTPLADGERAAILDALQQLPPHPEAALALSRLQQAGFRLMALSNTPPASLRPQLEHAGLLPYFERLFSAHELERYKPAPSVYQYAAHQLAVPLNAMVLVSAHAWDVIGALQAGCRGAFVRRPGKAWFHLRKPPEIVGENLLEVAEHLLHYIPQPESGYASSRTGLKIA